MEVEIRRQQQQQQQQQQHKQPVAEPYHYQQQPPVIKQCFGRRLATYMISLNILLVTLLVALAIYNKLLDRRRRKRLKLMKGMHGERSGWERPQLVGYCCERNKSENGALLAGNFLV